MTTHHILRRHGARTAGAALLALGVALTASACGSDDTTTAGDTAAASGSSTPTPSTNPSSASDSPSGQSQAHNDADVAFLTGMVPHHQQALVMIRMLRVHHADSDLTRLGEQMRTAQSAEIDLMNGWLTGWGSPTPSAYDHGPMGGMGGMGGSPSAGASPWSGMAGMMSDDDMMRLDDADGSGFDRMWLTMMIAHHEGAVRMARTEQAEGGFGPAKELAGRIIASQTAEIATMRHMLED